jgi:hypothetical protein
MKKSKTKLWCFACKQQVSRSLIKRSGRSASGHVWHVCKDCSAVYVAGRELDDQAYHAAQSDT